MAGNMQASLHLVVKCSVQFYHADNLVLQEELMEIKELPISNERPECLSEKYDR